MASVSEKYGKPKFKVAESPINQQKLKTILYWNEAYGSTEYGFCCGQKPYYEFECPIQNCFVTNNRTHLKSIDEYDAILFHQRSLREDDLPNKRSQHQKYIMYMMESASYPFGFRRYSDRKLDNPHVKQNLYKCTHY